MNSSRLKRLIVESLEAQGFQIRDGRIIPPQELDKDDIRGMHALPVRHRIGQSRERLLPLEPMLLRRFALGTDLHPEAISPILEQVEPDSENEVLFRYATLHWSIPVSSGYGRRLRFLVIDEQNGKLIGLIGLGDPVFSLRARDDWIGWDRETRREKLQHVMDAFVLGAVPPYSFLLCGKLVAMLAASDEVRTAFRAKYGGARSVIRRRTLDGRLAVLTTTSALGRSSIYNRLNYRGRRLYHSVGLTQGSGEFHFANGLYGLISQHAAEHCQPTAKQARWGTGFRNRREVVKKCLAHLGLSTDWLYHGIRRKIFVVPLASNSQAFLRGEHSRLQWHTQPVRDLFEYFRQRWLLPRASWETRHHDFSPSSLALWSGSTLP